MRQLNFSRSGETFLLQTLLFTNDRLTVLSHFRCDVHLNGYSSGYQLLSLALSLDRIVRLRRFDGVKPACLLSLSFLLNVDWLRFSSLLISTPTHERARFEILLAFKFVKPLAFIRMSLEEDVITSLLHASVQVLDLLVDFDLADVRVLIDLI